MLDGYVVGATTLNIAEYLIQEGARVVGNEKIDGHDCIIIEAKTSCGQFKLWLDPAMGCLFRRVESHKDKADKGKPRSDDAFVSYDLVVSNVVIETIQGKPLITSLASHWKAVEPSGTVVEWKGTASRKNIELNPVFDDKTFVTDLPTMTTINNLDDHDSGVVYIWDGEKPVAGYTFLEGQAVMGTGVTFWLRMITMIGWLLTAIAVILWLISRNRKR
jgi:hypothetical protein